jgi:hypothetical protein
MTIDVEIPVSGDALVAALTFSVPLKIAGQILHRSRSRLYELAGEGLLDFVKSGARSEVTIESIRRYQKSLPRNVIKPDVRVQERAKVRAGRRRSRSATTK